MAPTIGVNLRVTGHCNQGSRRHMEDMFSVAYQQTEDELDLEYAYFGIFDGHGGHEAATFAKEHLMKAIVSQPGFWSDNDKDVLRAIKDGFIATHYAMWKNLENWPKTQSGWPSTSGTTASIAFIRRSNIYIGHVGDSCIVLGYQDPYSDHWKGAALTQDHKPENPIEYERISQAGGMVVQKSGVPRVVWHRPRLSHKGPLTRSTHIDQIPFLAVARSLGDLWSYNADSDRFVVSPEPDVSVHHIDLTRDRCLIFGTDGLWNMLTPDEAVSIVRKAEFNNKSGGNSGEEQIWLNPSKCLVDNALNKWMKFELRADNTSAVTLLLDPLGPPHSQVLNQQNAASNIQSEFVPYHIESYKVNDTKSPNKLHSQSSGLAICTWYPHRNLSENLKEDETTTLTAMEELFGKKVGIFDCKNGEACVDQCDSEKLTKSTVEDLLPTTSKTSATKEPEFKKLPRLYSEFVQKRLGRLAEKKEKERFEFQTKSKSEDLSPTTSKTSATKELKFKKLPPVYSEFVQRRLARIAEKKEKERLEFEEKLFLKLPKSEGSSPLEKSVSPLQRDVENDSQEVDENVNRMKLRGSLPAKVIPDEKESLKNEISLSKNYQKNAFQPVTIKRNGKRGKRRKTYGILESEFNLLGEGKSLRSRSKRRHSSLFETMNLMYEPRPKRRTRSEDHKKVFDGVEYRSDTENKSDEETTKTKRISRIKTKAGDCGKSSERTDETTRQNHLQERLQHNNNSNSNNNSNNSNGSNSMNGTTGSGSNGGNGCFTPMRLRSNVPVKTLRSRNINLEICDWFSLGLTKYSNVNSSKKSLSKQQQQQQQQNGCKTDEPCDNGAKSLTKLNALTRSSINSTKLQVNESPYRSAVHTRSQNKRLKK